MVHARLASGDDTGRHKWRQTLEPQVRSFHFAVPKHPRLDYLVSLSTDKGRSVRVHPGILSRYQRTGRIAHPVKELSRSFHCRPPFNVAWVFAAVRVPALAPFVEPAHARMVEVG
jgi:hypothetical protein